MKSPIYRFYIDQWFIDQKAFEVWIEKHLAKGWRLFSIKSFGYIPHFGEPEPDELLFNAENIIFTKKNER